MKVKFYVSLLVTLLFLYAATPALADFTILSNFTGVTYNEEPAINGGFQVIPPDTNGAAGPNQYVELVNGGYAVYSKTGALQSPMISMDQFWLNAGVTPTGSGGPATTDPRIIFDQDSQRWFASSIDLANTGNHYLLAVSKSADPTQGWTGFSIVGDPSRFDDFDTLGLDHNGVYLAANEFTSSSGTGVGTNVIAVSKSGLTAATPTATFTNFGLQNPNNTGYTPHPAVNYSSVSTDNPLLSDYDTTHGALKVSDVTYSAGSFTLNASNGPTSVAPASPPPLARQPDGSQTLATGDSRFSATVRRLGNDLWGVQSISQNGAAAVRWYDLDATTYVVKQQGTISSSTMDYYYPSIDVNGAGVVVIGFSGSGPSNYASSYAVEGVTTAGVTTFGTPILLQAGTGNYNVTLGGASNRWGDYSATTIDPNNPNVFWTIQEYADGTNNWGTQITELGTVPEPPSGPADIALGVTVLGFIRRRVVERRVVV